MDFDIQGGSTARTNEDHNLSIRKIDQRNHLAKKISKYQNLSTDFPFTPGASPLDFQQSTESPRSCHHDAHVSSIPITLTPKDAFLYHHFTAHLGRWMDCTNSARILTLRITEMARLQPILHHAVICFAARHCGEDEIADLSYQRCIALLIDRLDVDPAHDDTLLTTVIILHFADQLNVRSSTGLCDQSHLSGSSGILRASQKTPFIDPSAPTVHDAIFWVYVRQSLYNATIRQQPLDLDFSLTMSPTPGSLKDPHPLGWLRLETSWANQLLWYTACVANFSFAGTKTQCEPGSAAHKQQEKLWTELRGMIQTWRNSRPSSFDPIWEGAEVDESIFPDIFFTADWHVISFTFYHFACILLLTYKPGPRIGTRIVHNEASRVETLQHAEAICCASRSSPQNPQLFIILCHTVFIWGPLLMNSAKRMEVLRLLKMFEDQHSWGTSWISNALKVEWGL